MAFGILFRIDQRNGAYMSATSRYGSRSRAASPCMRPSVGLKSANTRDSWFVAVSVEEVAVAAGGGLFRSGLLAFASSMSADSDWFVDGVDQPFVEVV